MPTIKIEKTDVAQIYLSKDSLDTEIITANSSSVNVNVPDPENEFLEVPIPEQFKTYWTGTTFKTVAVELKG